MASPDAFFLGPGGSELALPTNWNCALRVRKLFSSPRPYARMKRLVSIGVEVTSLDAQLHPPAKAWLTSSAGCPDSTWYPWISGAEIDDDVIGGVDANDATRVYERGQFARDGARPATHVEQIERGPEPRKKVGGRVLCGPPNVAPHDGFVVTVGVGVGHESRAAVQTSKDRTVVAHDGEAGSPP